MRRRWRHRWRQTSRTRCENAAGNSWDDCATSTDAVLTFSDDGATRLWPVHQSTVRSWSDAPPSSRKKQNRSRWWWSRCGLVRAVVAAGWCIEGDTSSTRMMVERLTNLFQTFLLCQFWSTRSREYFFNLMGRHIILMFPHTRSTLINPSRYIVRCATELMIC